MVQPAPRMTSAPLKNRRVVPTTDIGCAIGDAKGAAKRQENRQGKKR